MKELAEKLGFVQTFLFFQCFLFLLFYSSVSLLYVSAAGRVLKLEVLTQSSAKTAKLAVASRE